jgi:hypothetical protein
VLSSVDLRSQSVEPRSSSVELVETTIGTYLALLEERALRA